MKEAGFEPPDDALFRKIPISSLRNEVEKRRIQFDAARLGVGFTGHENPICLREKVIRELPDILAEKAIVPGAVVISDDDPLFASPQLLLGFGEEAGHVVILRDLERSDKEYETDIIRFGLGVRLHKDAGAAR